METTGKDVITAELSRCELLAGIGDALSDIAERARTETFQKGDELYKSGNLAFLLSGKAKIHAPNGAAIMRDITAGEVFGAVSLFGNGDFGGSVTASGECAVAYLGEPDVEDLLNVNAVFRNNYICFLTGKLRFLNDKIAGFTTPGASERLLSAFRDCADENGFVALPCSMGELANRLNISRAGLYRAVSALTASGKIAKTDGRYRLCEENDL